MELESRDLYSGSGKSQVKAEYRDSVFNVLDAGKEESNISLTRRKWRKS